MIISPGHVLAVLAVLGLVVSVWPLRRRLLLGLATAVATVLTLGTQAPGGGGWSYLLLYRHLPGWDALRTPGRLVLWVTMGLALLAAGLVGRLAELLLRRAADREVRPISAVRLTVGVYLLAVPTLLVGADDWGGPLHWPVAQAPVVVATVPAPLMFLAH